MEPIELVEGLAGFPGRGAGTDAERRAAAWLADELSSGAHNVVVETFWCRPSWALAHALHSALAVAGGLISLASPVAGVSILAITLASVLADPLGGVSLGRRLTPERASQNVIATSPTRHPGDPRVRLTLTANYDAGRTGLVYRDSVRRTVAAAKRVLRGFALGWLGWLSLGVAWLLAVAILRLTGHTSHAISAAQFPPTIALLVGLALLLDIAVSNWSPGAADNASGVAVATAVAQALETAPPQHLEVELVATGAGDGDQIGLRRYLRDRRGERGPANTVVLGIAAWAAGRPCWWRSDGALIPMRYARSLRRVAEKLAAEEPHLRARPHNGRGTTPALPARIAGIPAMTLGFLDERGLARRSHQPGDTIETLDPRALEAAVRFALLMVDSIDAAVADLQQERAATPA